MCCFTGRAAAQPYLYCSWHRSGCWGKCTNTNSACSCCPTNPICMGVYPGWTQVHSPQALRSQVLQGWQMIGIFASRTKFQTTASTLVALPPHIGNALQPACHTLVVPPDKPGPTRERWQGSIARNLPPNIKFCTCSQSSFSRSHPFY